MSRILLIGATSAIAQACARHWALAGHSLYLLARDAESLQALAADLRLRGAASVQGAQFDANDLGRHPALIDQAIATLGGLDIALIAHGTLGDQRACQADFPTALHEINTNAISVLSLLTHLANRFEALGQGTLAVISSVAGDRGRRSNYVYGAAKGMVSLFTQGLRQRLHKAGVRVLTIKPGFVDTPMTAAFRKGPLWATPDYVARKIDQAIHRQRNILYVPAFWALVMALIKAIPEAIFKRMSL